MNPSTPLPPLTKAATLAGSSPNQDPHWSVYLTYWKLQLSKLSHHLCSCSLSGGGIFQIRRLMAPPSVTIQELPPSPALVTQQLFPLDLPFFPLSTFPPTSSPLWTFPPNIVPSHSPVSVARTCAVRRHSKKQGTESDSTGFANSGSTQTQIHDFLFFNKELFWSLCNSID